MFCLLLFPLSLFAEEDANLKRFGDWDASIRTVNGNLIAIASTKNAGGSILGIMCVEEDDDGDTCVSFVNFNLTCTAKNEYPALVSTDDGVVATTLECLIIDGANLMVMDGGADKIVKNNRYGIVIATGDKFKAAHFSLNGSTKAYLAARDMKERYLGQTSNKKEVKYQDEIL